MREDWTRPEMARDWNADPTGHNPTRPEQLDILLSMLEAEYEPGKSILDIGMGSGIVEELIFRRIPEARIVGIDSSEPMIALARQRLRPYVGRYRVIVHDIREMPTLQMPDGEFGVVISVQTIHNVQDRHKREIFAFIHRVLEPEGLFLTLDRIAVDTPRLFTEYATVWQRLNRLHDAHIPEGLFPTLEEMNAWVEARGDLPITLEQHLAWLREAGFEVACLHLHGNRALFAARKMG